MKLALSEEARGGLEKQTELLKQVLEDKEKETNDTKNQLRQAKEEAICEYRDFDALLAALGGSFAEGFDDASVKSRLLILTWTYLMSILIPRTKPQFSLSTPRVRTSCSLMMP